MNSERVERALALATKLHEGQYRKNGTDPYVTHLIAVHDLLSEYTDDEDVLIAALMHDAIEDVPGYTYERLVSDCGENVAKIVWGVTEEGYPEGYKQLPREEKVKMFAEMLLKQAEKIERTGKESLMVSVADKIHNIESMMHEYLTIGPEFLQKFKMGMDQKIGYYRDILRRAKPHVPTGLSERLDTSLKRAEELFLK